MKMDKSKFLNLIREELESYGKIGQEPEVISEEEEGTKLPPLEDWLPTIGITENWGKLGDKSRDQIRVFISKLGGGIKVPGGGLFESRMASLAHYVGEVCKVDAAGNFARIVILDICHSIISGFSASSAGFVFEAFAAVMSGAEGEQVTEKGATGLPIVDFKDGTLDYSLKLLAGIPEGGTASAAGDVKGSFKNLVGHFLGRKSPKYAGKQSFLIGKGVRYITTFKEADKEDPKLKFYYFDLNNKTIPTFMNAMTPEARGKLLKDGSKYKNGIPDGVTFADLYREDQLTDKDAQFVFTRHQLDTLLGKNVVLFAEFKSLSLIREKAMECSAKLQKDIVPMYKGMKDLTHNMNLYFVGHPSQKEKASRDADEIIKMLPDAFDKIKTMVEKND